MKKSAIILVAFLSILIVYISINSNKNNDNTEIHIMPGSKSDCTIILSENKSLMVLDDFVEDLSYIKNHISNKIENNLLILSYEEKYFENYTELLQQIKVSNIYFINKEGISEFIEKANNNNINTISLNEDKVFRMDKTKVYFKMENKEPLVIIKHPELSMVCLYNANTNYSFKKEDIIKFSKESRSETLNTGFLNKNKIDTMIFSNNEPVTEIEANEIKKANNEIKVISAAKEGNIIYYKKEKGFGVTSESNMKIRIQ